MAKPKTISNRLKRLLFRLPQIAIPALFGVIGIAFIAYTYQATPIKDQKQTTETVSRDHIVRHHTRSPKPVPQPTPAVATTTPTTSHKISPAANPQITTGKSLPVVVPSPSSSVSTLTPTTPSPPASSGSSSSSSSSSPATTTGYTSTNWSGYLSTVGNYTKVSGSWKATNPTGVGARTSADGTWVGIGGVTSGDLIQVGTNNFVSPSGQLTTSAFYEMLPASAVTIPSITVSPGDSLSASVSETSPGQWTIIFSNNTNNETFSINVTYSSTNSSAEWIEEDPSINAFRQYPFDNFGTVSFTNGLATSNGSNQTISGSSAQPVTLVSQSNQPIATPSAIGSDGQSFSVTHD